MGSIGDRCGVLGVNVSSYIWASFFPTPHFINTYPPIIYHLPLVQSPNPLT